MRESRYTDKKERKGRGGKKFSLNLRITTTPTRVHFQAPAELYEDPRSGAKLPWKVGKRHYVPTKADGSGTYVDCGDQCVVCAYTAPADFDLDIEVDSKLAKCYPATFYALQGWVEEWHHLVQYERDDKSTYMVRERCQGQNCEFCKVECQKVFGNRFALALSRKAWNEAIFPFQEEVEGHCRCGGNVYVPEYLCTGCKAPLIDVCNSCYSCKSEEIALDLDNGMAECQSCNSSWSVKESGNEDLEKAANQEAECACGVKDYPNPHAVCTEEGCDADSHDLFDAQVTLVKATADKTASTSVKNWKFQKPDERLFDPKYQGDDDMAKKIAEAFQKPMDLDRQFAPDPPHTTAQRLGVKNPFAEAGGGDASQYRRYKKD